jgi:hypothetical protein
MTARTMTTITTTRSHPTTAIMPSPQSGAEARHAHSHHRAPRTHGPRSIALKWNEPVKGSVRKIGLAPLSSPVKDPVPAWRSALGEPRTPGFDV